VRRWRWPVALVVVVLVLGTGGYAMAQARDTGPSYRTARASLGDVEHTLDLSGTVTAAGRRDLSFGAAGTVSKVVVRAGQRVKSGQVLARLDTTAFDAAVTSAVATLAKAKAQLASDENAQAGAVTASATSTPASTVRPRASSASKTPTASSTPGPKGSAPAGGTDPALQAMLTKLDAEQKAVESAQSDASDAISAAKAALTAQTQACKPEPGSGSGTSTTASPSAIATGSGSDGGSGGGAGESSVSAACTEALAGVQAAQDTVAQKQDTLQSALSALGETLGQGVAALGKSAQSQGATQGGSGSGSPNQGGQSSGQPSSQPSSQPSAQSPGASGRGGEGTGQGTGGAGGAVTAARLAQDQADIDTAGARLNEARTNRQSAMLRAPYAGRILQSDIAKGDLVAASDPAFVLVGKGVTTVSASVTPAQVPSVRRGQRVTVVPAGWTTSLTGTVSAIGLLPGSDSTFPVTVTLNTTKAVAEGTTASVAIVTGSASNAVTIPLTALTRIGQRATVQVLSGGTATPTQVTVGVVGTRRVAITQGLEQGASVVLADLGATVPSSTSSQTPRFSRGAGGGGAGLGSATFQRAGE
jgi:HlyD family secretion protein